MASKGETKSVDPLDAMYSHVEDPDGELKIWGPFCVSCMSSKFSDGEFTNDTVILSHTSTFGTACRLSDLIIANGDQTPFLDCSGEKFYSTLFLCSTVVCRDRCAKKVEPSHIAIQTDIDSVMNTAPVLHVSTAVQCTIIDHNLNTRFISRELSRYQALNVQPSRLRPIMDTSPRQQIGQGSTLDTLLDQTDTTKDLVVFPPAARNHHLSSHTSRASEGFASISRQGIGQEIRGATKRHVVSKPDDVDVLKVPDETVMPQRKTDNPAETYGTMPLSPMLLRTARKKTEDIERALIAAKELCFKLLSQIDDVRLPSRVEQGNMNHDFGLQSSLYVPVSGASQMSSSPSGERSDVASPTSLSSAAGRPRFGREYMPFIVPIADYPLNEIHQRLKPNCDRKISALIRDSYHLKSSKVLKESDVQTVYSNIQSMLPKDLNKYCNQLLQFSKRCTNFCALCHVELRCACRFLMHLFSDFHLNAITSNGMLVTEMDVTTWLNLVTDSCIDAKQMFPSWSESGCWKGVDLANLEFKAKQVFHRTPPKHMLNLINSITGDKSSQGNTRTRRAAPSRRSTDNATSPILSDIVCYSGFRNSTSSSSTTASTDLTNNRFNVTGRSASTTARVRRPSLPLFSPGRGRVPADVADMSSVLIGRPALTEMAINSPLNDVFQYRAESRRKKSRSGFVRKPRNSYSGQRELNGYRQNAVEDEIW